LNPFSQFEDEELMQKYQAGEFMAFEVIYARHQNRVYSYLSARLSNQNAVEEVFQNAFLKLHKFKDKYDSNYLFVKWLYTICRSELLDYVKKKQVDLVALDEQVIAIDDPSIDTDFDLEQISCLSDREKQALQLKFYSDQDYDEISKILGTSQVNARKIISRAIGKLKKKFAGGVV